ncbi:hypothetical protein ABPG74_018648 [Tetrahymena malaccensis]
MLQRSNNHFEIEDFNILHMEKVANLIFRSYSEANLVWNILQCKREQAKTAILRRLQRCLKDNLSHVAVQNNRVVACIISMDLKNLEDLLKEEAQQKLPEPFQYLSQANRGFYDYMVQFHKEESHVKSSVMLFCAVEPEFQQTLLFFNLVQWNIDQIMLSRYKKYFGIAGIKSRFMKLAEDKVSQLQKHSISDQENKEINNYEQSLLSYDLQPLLPRPSL